MNFQLSPEQKAFRTEVRAFIAERLPADIRARLRAGHPPRKEDTVIWQRILNERGWAAPHWPRKFGGAELGQLERLILLDELYRAPAPLPQVFNVMMLGPLLMKFGTAQQCEYFLPKLASLDLWFCQGFSEPGAGSDLASLRTTARLEGDKFVVNGQKIWTTTAHWADWIFALVRTNPEARKQEGISFLLIDLKSPGITIRPIYSIDGEHHLNEVFFEEVSVPLANLVGEEDKGWDCAKFLLSNERAGIANIGLCRERLDRAREVATLTWQAGDRLIDDPKLRSELAGLDAEIRALEVTNWRFLLTPSAQQELPSFPSVLKLKGVELQQEINALLARLAGIDGLERRDAEDTTHGPLTPRYFYSRATSIYGGTNEVQKDILARALVG
ncbi:acyl-CoA dehydrogenase family protein [Cupriavidus consociatus]|uniref:acyl-CoA dehydrogenase family protein n=1 Tax=Cupriavidus consociatus TaxID=2821357 RepID=UPI001AE92298|nr:MULTISPECIES: acyl-CoA dehydrogenase family protein [unclassified Cupriavidus]MBP0623775.1 acyl-CoA dehydrogenase family protein [Cupriavidus sp. LEh25]MDK2660481.1 acyl-CoA dehydrogenase family protein [Cupriavidus sp. LEh21]